MSTDFLRHIRSRVGTPPIRRGYRFTISCVTVAVCVTLTALLLVAHGRTNQAKTNYSGTHRGIVTTIFWVGETADADNGGIPNAESAWDDQWLQHYGGTDSQTSRNGNLPAGFTPKENPFYVALPYNDIAADGSRKTSAAACSRATGSTESDNHSWCKNGWLAISHGGKTVYAQWEDVGPFEEDDAGYVFGSAKPRNARGEKAGLDVSPAVQSFLMLEDVDTTNWHFVKASAVPDGPWKAHITRSMGYTVD